MPDENVYPAATNHGVYQSGGTSTVGNQAVGQGARAYSGPISFASADSGARADAAGLLARIEQLLDEHAAGLPDAGATRLQIHRLRDELCESEPEPRVLQRTLDRLTSLVQPVAPLVVAVGQLSQAVQSALGR